MQQGGCGLLCIVLLLDRCFDCRPRRPVTWLVVQSYTAQEVHVKGLLLLDAILLCLFLKAVG